MPYDPNLSLEQMRAFLMSQGVFPQNDVYDDGASLLGQNPNMQQIGFKVPKVPKIFDIPHDPGRRTMGLTLPKQSNLPSGPQTPFAQTLQKEKEATKAVSLPQEVQPQTPSVSPLEYATEAIKNLPMTRRQVLQTPLNAAVSHYGRKLLGSVDPVVETTPVAVESELILPTFSEEEIANKTGKYLAGLMANPDFQRKYASTYLTNPNDEFYLEHPEEMYGAREYHMNDADTVKQFASPEEAINAFSQHLSLDTLSKETGIPVSELEKYISTSDLHDQLNRIGNMTSFQVGMIEDGRPKEAWRSSVLSDLDYKKITKSAIKELGKDADYEDIMQLAEEKVREKYLQETLRDNRKGKPKFDDLVFQEGLKNYGQDYLDSVYDQASEYVQDELASQLDNLLGD